MTQTWPFIILMFVVAIIFFISGYLFSMMDKEDEILVDTFEWNCEIESIITELEKINSSQWNDAVKFGVNKAIYIVKAHRRNYINEE